MNIGGDLLSVAAAGFGLRLLARMAKNAPGKNVIVSPLGPFQGMSLFGFVGDEQARQSIRAALKIDDIEQDMLHTSFGRFGKSLAIENSSTEYVLASSLWAGRSLRIDASFVDLARQWDISLFCGGEVSDEEMRQWALTKTRGLLIPTLPTPPADAMSLLNAVYFRGTWKSRFAHEHTKNRFFYRPGQLPTSAPSMRQPETRTVQLYRGDLFDAARIPYADGDNQDWSLQVLLPHENLFEAVTGKDCLSPFLNHLTLSHLDSCQSGYQEAFVDLILPRFKLRQTHGLRPALTQIGLGDVFARRDFQEKTLPSLQEVRQQIYMDVNETGTEAAALTETASNILSPAVPDKEERPVVQKFYVNRPFLFLLTDDRSGLPLFVGAMHDVAGI